MNWPPHDPIEDAIQATRAFFHRLALNFMDEAFIVSAGNMTDPNEIVTTRLYFEKLENEPTPRRRVAQQLRRSQERTHKRLRGQAVMLCASLLARAK